MSTSNIGNLSSSMLVAFLSSLILGQKRNHALCILTQTHVYLELDLSLTRQRLVKLTSLRVVRYFDEAIVRIDKALVTNRSVAMGTVRIKSPTFPM